LTSDLMFIGHVSMDQIENQHGTRVQAGGAALYAAMAAGTLVRDVTLVSAIGKDYKFKDTLKPLNSTHVRAFNMPSTTFNIRYNKLGEAEYLKAVHGAGAKVTASAIPTRLLSPETMVHITPMQPSKVRKIVHKIRKNSEKTRISINTWIDYIKESRRNRTTLKSLVKEADFFIVNDTEAKALTQTDSISTALSALEAKMLIVTLGQLGAIIKGTKHRNTDGSRPKRPHQKRHRHHRSWRHMVRRLPSNLQTNTRPHEISHHRLHNLQHQMRRLGSRKTQEPTFQETRRRDRIRHRPKRRGSPKENNGLHYTLRFSQNFSPFPRSYSVGQVGVRCPCIGI